MKSKAAIFWFVVSLVLAGLLFAQWNNSKKQQLKMEELQLQVEKSAATSKETAARVQELESARHKVTAELRATEFELNNSRMAYNALAQMTNAPQGAMQAAAQHSPGQRGNQAGPAGMGQMLANMMKDPDTRKMLEQQQRMGMDMVYGSLYKKLQLTPEQQEKLKDLLVSQQMENMARAGEMFQGQGTPPNKELIDEMGEKNKQNQDQIKELLGEDNYAKYQDYNQTVGERMMLEQVSRQANISPEQNEQLLSILAEEKKNMQINRGIPGFDQTQDWQKLMQGNFADNYFEQQEQVNARVLERAGQVLTPKQLEEFGPVLKSQLEMQRASMKMARQMFGGSAEAQQPLPPTPVPEQP